MCLLRKRVYLHFFLFLGSLTAILSGCVVPKKVPAGKPFVYATNITIQGNLSAAVKSDLRLKLENQLDDSLKTPLKTAYPGRLLLIHPPVFDTASALRSVLFMNNLLEAEGYYSSVISWDSTLQHKGKQARVTVNFKVNPGHDYKFDSVSYRLADSALEQLALDRRGASLLKKGEPYSIEVAAAELDRLVELFRNNGYYKFSRDDLTAERDTIFSALINPSLDPFEQLRLLQEARQRKNNPQMNIVISLRNPSAVTHFRKYRIRNVSVYPDLDLLEDTTMAVFDSVTVKGIRIFSKYNKFKPAFIAERCLLLPGSLFRLRNSTRTYTNYTQLNTFTQVTVDIREAGDSSAALDIVLRMYPSKKQDISISLDASYNTGDVVTTGNLFGVGLNLGLNNRNVARQAIQSSTNLRTGVEIDPGSKFLQTIQTSLSHNYVFPRLILPASLLRIFRTDSLRNQRTLLNFNGAYTDRKDFYELKSLNASMGYQFTSSSRQRKSHTWFFSPINVEYVQLNAGAKLLPLLESVPNLKFSFNTGLVISMIGGYNYVQVRSDGAKVNDLRIGLEESGGLSGLVKKFDQNFNLYRFVKLDADLKHYINYKKSALVFRLYGGIGVPYGRNKDGSSEQQLPFFKAFYAGGPYSMRAWQVRQLGIGSSRYFDTASKAKGVDRFGDIQLEGNIEYRFNLGSLFGIKLKSAFFTDIGNIWYRSTYNNPLYAGAEFNINKLYTDIAVGAGTSLRLDFDYFLIRFDWSYKIKDPVYSYYNYGWLHDIELAKGQFQLGINYPF